MHAHTFRDTAARSTKSSPVVGTEEEKVFTASIAPQLRLRVSISRAQLVPAHHSHPSSHVHYFIPGSKLTFSTNLFHHSLLAPTWTAFSDYTGPDIFCSTFFIFSYFSFYYFGSCGRLSWRNRQLPSAR